MEYFIYSIYIYIIIYVYVCINKILHTYIIYIHIIQLLLSHLIHRILRSLKCLLCWWKPSNKLEGLHCTALTLSRAHSATTQGLGQKFGHRGLLSHLGRFRGGKYQAKPKKHLRSEEDPMNETNMVEKYHNPATRTKHTTVNEKMKANIPWDPPTSHWKMPVTYKKRMDFQLQSTKMTKNVTQSLAGGTWKLWMKRIDFWFFDKKPSGPLVGPPISYLSSLLVVAFFEYLKKIGRCWWLKDWRTWRAGIRFPEGNRSPK